MHVMLEIPSVWKFPRVEQISADQLSAIVHATPAALLGSALNTAIVAISFAGSVADLELVLWCMTSFFVTGYVSYRPNANRHRPSTSVSIRAIRRAFIIAVLLALPWATLVTAHLGSLSHNNELILVALCAGMAASGSVYLSPVFPAALAYMAVILLPAAVKCFFLPGYGMLGWLTLSYAAFLCAVIATNARLSIDRTHALRELAQKIFELDKARDAVEHLAMHDLLTGLSNRLGFARALGTAHNTVLQSAKRFALLCLDLDGFKTVNDTFGHPVGDRLLSAVSNRLNRCVRSGDLVARIGGDEFAVLQFDITGREDCSLLARRIAEVLSTPFSIDEHVVSIGTSIGIAIAPDDGAQPDELLKNADIALYRAKADKRGTYRFFEHATPEEPSGDATCAAMPSFATR